MIKDNFLLSCFLLIVTGMLILGCQGKTFDPAFLQEKAPAEFTLRFETTKGRMNPCFIPIPGAR